MPNRISRSASAARSGGEIAGSRANSVIGNGAQNSADPPGATITPRCAASTATASTSATPTEHSISSDSTASTILSAAALSLPK